MFFLALGRNLAVVGDEMKMLIVLEGETGLNRMTARTGSPCIKSALTASAPRRVQRVPLDPTLCRHVKDGGESKFSFRVFEYATERESLWRAVQLKA